MLLKILLAETQRKTKWALKLDTPSNNQSPANILEGVMATQNSQLIKENDDIYVNKRSRQKQERPG